MPSKCTFFLTSGPYRWTEYHYNAAGFTNLIQATALVQAYVGLRTQCLGLNASMRSVRVSRVPANSEVADVFTLLNTSPTWPLSPATVNAAPSFTGALVRLTDTSGDHRNFFLAGAPGFIFQEVQGSDRGINLNNVPDWANRYLTFMSYLTSQSSGWGWITRTDSILTPALGPLVTNAAFPGMVGVQVAAAIPALTIGTQALLKGWRRIARPNGKRLSGAYRIGGVLAPVAPSTVWTYFLFNTGQVVPTNFKTIGQIGPLTLVFQPYAVGGFSLEQVVTRKRGARAYAPQGKSNLQ